MDGMGNLNRRSRESAERAREK
uniref:Uncharacterized protein n=1 Tax=Rhizophora mucronata TaxID=61149 RepID=A0A2P2PH15_RHIMU